MICKECNHEVQDGTKFCIYCGAPLHAVQEPELVLNPQQEMEDMDRAIENAAMDAKQAMDDMVLDPFAGAEPVMSEPDMSVYQNSGQAVAYQTQPGNEYAQKPTGYPGVPAGGMQQTAQPAQTEKQPGHGAAVASLVLGISSLILCFLSAGVLSVINGVIGLVLAGISKRAGNTSGVRTGGFATSLIGVIMGVLTFLACVALMAYAGGI